MYEENPHVEINRADGSVMRFYRSLEDPNAFKMVLDGVDFNITDHLQEMMDKGNLKQ